MKKIKTVSIGISAYNEEANISSLLNSLVKQKQNGFKLKKITVANDGSTDSTAKIVRELAKKNKFIKLISDKKRLGKAQRLNNFYKTNKSDVFVTFDADVKLKNNLVLKELVRHFEDKSVGLVGGCALPLPPRNFFEKIVYSWHLLWFDIRNNLNGGYNIHNHSGCVSSVSSKLTPKIKIPDNKIPDDDFVYLTALKEGYNFKFAREAVVYYSTVNSLKEYLLQDSRLIHSKKYAIDYFGPQTAGIYKTPRSLQIKTAVKHLRLTPLFIAIAIFLQILVRNNLILQTETYSNGFWHVARSSKRQNYEQS